MIELQSNLLSILTLDQLLNLPSLVDLGTITMFNRPAYDITRYRTSNY